MARRLPGSESCTRTIPIRRSPPFPAGRLVPLPWSEYDGERVARTPHGIRTTTPLLCSELVGRIASDSLGLASSLTATRSSTIAQFGSLRSVVDHLSRPGGPDALVARLYPLDVGPFGR